MSFNNIIDFISRLTTTINELFNTLFFERFQITIGADTVTILPIGLLTGSIALIIGMLRRIL